MPTLTFNATIEEERAIREAARRRKLNLSAYLRCVAIPTGAAPAKARLMRSPRTGACIVAPQPGLPVLTSAKVRSLLVDFP